MAKLADLKKLVDEARVRPPSQPPAEPARRRPRSRRRPGARSPRRVTATAISTLHRRLRTCASPPHTRRHHAPPRPAPIPRQRIADDESALMQSKYGAEPTPDSWEVGQEHEAGQTFCGAASAPTS